MTPIEPPPPLTVPADSNRPRRRRPDLTLPITQKVWSPAAPFIPPPAASSSTSSSPLMNFSELERTSRVGGRGTVYKVFHRPTGKFYALRVFNGTHDDSVRRKIRREIKNLCNVDNPSVVKCHGVFDNDGEIQILFEYMDGGSLKGVHIADEPSLADVTRQILLGLYYLHSKRIVHRDIKPSNLLINSQTQVKIADLGISRMLVEMTDASTIAYFSPERISTDMCPYDGYKGDLWSVGVTILELYLGTFPFPVAEQSDWASLISVILAEPPPEAPQTASTEFRDFIACCLQRDPGKRWTAEQLLRHPFISQNHNQVHWHSHYTCSGLCIFHLVGGLILIPRN